MENRVERQQRAAANQALFRAVNERIAELNQTLSPFTERFVIACECADTTCVDQLEVTTEEYAVVRANPRHFLVRRGHVFADVEDVVAERDGHAVVEKHAQLAAIVEETA